MLALLSVLAATYPALAAAPAPVRIAVFDFELEDASAAAANEKSDPATDARLMQAVTQAARQALSQSGRYLVERFGPMRFAFKLPADASGLEMDMRRWSIFHIPMPIFLAPRSLARESGAGDMFVFDVAIGLPLVGDVVRYKGTLRQI